MTIGDNVLSDVQTNIHLAGVRGVTITGNTFWKGYAHNLLVEDSHAGRRRREHDGAQSALRLHRAKASNGVVLAAAATARFRACTCTT